MDQFVRELLLPQTEMTLIFKVFSSKDDWPLDTKISRNERSMI